MDMPEDFQRRIAEDRVIWLTTVTDSGVPAPNPVWFVPDGADLVIFAAAESRKVHNMEQRPTVSLHFNSDRNGGDVAIITGEAQLTSNQRASEFPGYLAKYEADLPALGLPVEELDRTYHVRVRVRPTKYRTV